MPETTYQMYRYAWAILNRLILLIRNPESWTVETIQYYNTRMRLIKLEDGSITIKLVE